MVVMHTTTNKISFYEKCFGEVEPGRGGINVAVKCPNCNDREKKKFVIRVEDDACHCWVCGIRSKNLSSILWKYRERYLLDEYIEKFGASELIVIDQIDQVEQPVLPDDFRLLAQHMRSRDPDIKEALEYVKSRGLTEDDLWFYKIGYSDAYAFKRRVVIPSFESTGRLNYYVTRAIDPDIKPKYINSTVKKTSVIFNDWLIDWNKELLIVEGPFDLIKCKNINATCILGSEVSNDSLLLEKITYNNTPVILALDADMEYKKQRIAKTLTSYGIDVKIIELSEDVTHDIGSMTNEQVKSIVSSAYEWNRDIGLTKRFDIIKFKSLV